MTQLTATPSTKASPDCSRGSSRLADRRLWLVLAAVALIAGAALNWQWLAAAGILPLLFAALPCVAMCTLHLCMRKDSNGQCGKDVPKPAMEVASTRR